MRHARKETPHTESFWCGVKLCYHYFTYQSSFTLLADTSTTVFILFTRTTGTGFITANFRLVTDRHCNCWLGLCLCCFLLTFKPCCMLMLELHTCRHFFSLS